MTILTRGLVVLLASAFFADAAQARIDIPWDGGYIGGNLGEAASSTCSSRALAGTPIDSVISTDFSSSDCSKSTAFVGGVQLGENFQHHRLVLGVRADIDLWDAATVNQSLKFSGPVPPRGTYTFSSREGPRGFAVLGSRIGYGGDTWLPYLSLGWVISAGAPRSTLFYTPTASKVSTASFDGGKEFSTSGWAAGGGFELGLNGAWSLSADYLHVNFGKGPDTSASCSGSAAACSAFSGISFNSTHEGFSANLFRIGITYWFGYW